MTKIKPLQNLIIFLGLGLSFISKAADSSMRIINSAAELAAARSSYKKGEESKPCKFPDCLKSVSYRNAKLHMLACHASAEFKSVHSVSCDLCGHKTLQRNNLNTHKIVKHDILPAELGIVRQPRSAKKRGNVAVAVVEPAAAPAPKRARKVKVSFFCLGTGTKATIGW